jgi:prepilin-type N-terminal cleavage/methylation domain-containing protein
VNRKAGFSLVELLVALGVLGIICTMVLQSVASSAQFSGTLNTSNELLREGQITVQLISNRVKEACYLHPNDTELSLVNTGFTATNPFNTSNQSRWVIGKHPMVAMLLPPEPDSSDYRFFAYYAIPRSQYVNNATGAGNPGKDARNDSSVWMLMEYRSNIPNVPAGTPCSSIPALATYADSIRGKSGNLLLDYVSPDDASSTLFTVGPINTLTDSAQWIQYNLRLQRQSTNGGLVVVGSNAGLLREKLYPHNLGL